MGLQQIKCDVTTYDFAWGYLVDVVDYPDSPILSVYLHHDYYYNYRMRMFDIDKEILYESGGHLFEEIESRLVHGSYIKEFEEKFLSDADDSDESSNVIPDYLGTEHSSDDSIESGKNDDIDDLIIPF